MAKAATEQRDKRVAKRLKKYATEVRNTGKKILAGKKTAPAKATKKGGKK